MELAELKADQKEALLDLLVLAMYSDGHLASAEDERIQRLVQGFDLESDYTRNQFIDGSFSRSLRQTRRSDERRQFILQRAHAFTSAEARDLVLSTLESLLASDNQVTSAESEFLALVRNSFRQS